MPFNFSYAGGLFTILGKIFKAQEDALSVVVSGGSIDTDITAVLTAFDALNGGVPTLDQQVSIQGLRGAMRSWQNTKSLLSGLEDVAKKFLIQFINDWHPLADRNLDTAVDYLIAIMNGSGGESSPDASVLRSTPTIVFTPSGSIVGDAKIDGTILDGDGRPLEIVLEEGAGVSVDAASQQLLFAGTIASGGVMDYDWPLGSGIQTGLSTASLGSSGLLTNGGFDSESSIQSSLPASWLLSVGAPGTTILMSTAEVQTVIISGSPASGSYAIKFTNILGFIQQTIPLTWNATGSAVQSAINLLFGLSSCTVVTTGTTPNYTHTITFTGAFPPGDQTILSSVNSLNTGSIAHAQVTAGTPAFYGRSLSFVGDGATVHSIYQKITLSPRTVYAFHCRLLLSAAPAAGVLKVELMDGVGGSVLTDAHGNSNVITATLTSGIATVGSPFTPVTGFFRIKDPVPDAVYIRIRLSTALSNAKTLYLDEAKLSQAQQLYPGGPFVAAFYGRLAHAGTDTWTATTTNDRAGEFNEWFYRNGLLPAGKYLPSKTSGNTIDDTTLIA